MFFAFIARLVGIEMRRLWLEDKTYLTALIFNWLNILLWGIGMGLGLDVAKQPGEEQFVFLFGLILWAMSTTALQSLSYSLQIEIRQGTLEQLFLSRTPVMSLMISRVLAAVLYEMLQQIVPVCTVAMVLGLGIHQVDLDIVIGMSLIISIQLIGLIGLGLCAGGLTLIFKRTGAVARSFSYFLLFFSGLMIPFSSLPSIIVQVGKIFPMFTGAASLRVMINTNSPILLEKFLISLLHSGAWLLIGFTIFSFCFHFALKRSSIGAMAVK